MAQDLSEDWRPSPVSGLHFRELQDGSLLLDAAKQKVHSLNERATIVWLLCDGTRSAQRILELAAHDEEGKASVRDVLDAFRKEGLVTSVPVTSHAHDA